MARIVITSEVYIRSDRDIETPLVPTIHSIGGGRDVPWHDRAAHAAGRPHECTRVRSARIFRGWVEDRRDAYRILSEQYRNHDVTWIGWEQYQ